VYGKWNPNHTVANPYPDGHPWTFWQYSSGERLQSFNSGGSNLDGDVARGGIEFLKDQLIPAVWTHDGSGDWGTLTNWNSGQAPIAPVRGPGQVPPVGTQTLPTPRLPGAAGSGVTSGQHDTVILERPNANITITLASGTHNIRKLYVRETLNITGGSLTINYIPSSDSTTNGAQFSGPVTLSGSGSFSVHTLQVDTNRVFTLAGGSLTLNTINLMPHASTPAKILMNGDAAFNPRANATAVIVKGAGAGSSGFIDLGGGARAFIVGNGTSEVDLSIDVPVSNGALTKSGPGTLRLTSANTYAGGTTVSAGRLFVNNTTGSGTGSGGVTVNGGTLGGTGTIAGPVTVNSGGTISPGTSIGTITLNGVPTFNGTTFLEINRNGGSSLADKIALNGVALNYGGTLVVSNTGAALIGGEVFTNFVAPAYSGAFTTISLPALGSGLNWYTGGLTADGTIKVNRKPVASPDAFTNVSPLVLQIPMANLTANDTDADGDALTLTGINLTTTNGVTLLTNSTFIFYSNYVSTADQFQYTISDERGGGATGTVYIAASPVARFTGAPSDDGNSVTLHITGRPGWTYYVERTTNLLNWTTISTNVAPPDGVFDYTDDFADLNEAAPAAFYRLRWSP
jgi:autotransporter-associated beta strand protein